MRTDFPVVKKQKAIIQKSYILTALEDLGDRLEDKVEMEQNNRDRKERRNIRKLWCINSENLTSKHKNLEWKKRREKSIK